jgi:hypothetical protein
LKPLDEIVSFTEILKDNVEFVALIYLSYIKQKMEEKGLFSKYTMHQLLDELDVIEYFTEPRRAPIQGEVLKKQEQIYRNLDVTPLLASPGKI